MTCVKHKWLEIKCMGILDQKKNRPVVVIKQVLKVECRKCGIFYFRLRDDSCLSFFGRFLNRLYINYEIKKQEKQIVQ